MIVINQDKCVIQIYDHAHLTELPLYKFRPLLQMASNKWQNDPEQIRAELLQTLERERIEREKDLERTDCYMDAAMRKHTISRLKKIEKMKSEVLKYV